MSHVPGLKDRSYAIYLHAQRIWRLINSESFIKKMEHLDEQTLKQIDQAIASQDYDLIVSLGRRSQDVSTLSYSELKNKAQQMRIPHWYQLRKPELIQAIRKHEAATNKRNDTTSSEIGDGP